MNAPAHLDAQARSKWLEILPTLQGRGEVDQGTADALAAYCTSYSRWVQAEAQVQALGPVVKSPAGFPVANPYLAVATAAQRQLRQWANELGLTPAAQKKVRTKKAKPDHDSPDPLLKLLASKRGGRKAG